MTKLLVALVASVFALVSASALAADGDGDFAPKSGWADAKARKEALAKERAAKRQAEIEAKKAGAATNENRQQYLTEQSKKGSGQ